MANVDMPPLKSCESGSDPDQSISTEISFKSSETHSASDRHYSCHHFASKVLHNLNCLRQDSRFCDVKVVAGGKVMRAHRAVLSASSPYFQAMFTTGLVEEQLETVELHAVDSHVLHILIDFIYTGMININQENVQELMIAADMLELKEVVISCTDFLKRELHLTNAIGIYRFAEGHNCESLATFALGFIHGHFPDVCNEDEFFELPKGQLIQFLSSEHLRIDTEFQVFQAAMRWIMHDVSQRRQFVFEILAHVRLPLLSMCLLDRAINDCCDGSLKVALRSVRKDLVTRKGNLVPLYVYPRICAKKDIFVIGGSSRELVSSWNRSMERTLESVERFDTYHRKWCRASPMGIGRILPGVAMLNGLIYVVGGEQESQILANGECYNPRDDTWSKVASMVVPRCEFGLCSLYGNLYAVGGWVGEDIGGSIEKYDPILDEWCLEGSLPEPRFSMGVISYDGLIYIVGGCIHSRRHLKDLLSYNPVTREWNSLPSMLVPRSQMGVAVLDGHLYVVGGTNRNHEVLSSVERYSFEENKWSEVLPMRIGRASPAVAAAGGLLYVIGGDQNHEVNFYRAQITINCVECYNPITEEWTDCPSLPQSRSEAGAVVV